MPGLQEFSGNEVPMIEVLAPPVTPLVGGKQIVLPFEERNDRIGCSPMFTLCYKWFNWTIAVIDIDRITICFLLSIRLYSQ
jgi:hypothetical protein